jgi:hypothetical protein
MQRLTGGRGADEEEEELVVVVVVVVGREWDEVFFMSVCAQKAC